MIPFCGPVQGKDWGITQCVFGLNGVEIWKLQVNGGWRCSQHMHNEKWNRFYVITGKLAVVVFQGDFAQDAPRDVTILLPGMCTDVPPGKWHYFAALEDSVAMEACWTAISQTDITRIDKGVCLTKAEIQRLSAQ